jgi:hypothetical protein
MRQFNTTLLQWISQLFKALRIGLHFAAVRGHIQNQNESSRHNDNTRSLARAGATTTNKTNTNTANDELQTTSGQVGRGRGGVQRGEQSGVQRTLQEAG